jgi:hypothetical protein
VRKRFLFRSLSVPCNLVSNKKHVKAFFSIVVRLE